jgi:hypothetical protein
VKIGDDDELGAAHQRDRGAAPEGLEDVNLRQEKLSERQMQLQKKGERDERFTRDVCSTDGNGGTEAVAMVNGVLVCVWVRCECKGEGVRSSLNLNSNRDKGKGER